MKRRMSVIFGLVLLLAGCAEDDNPNGQLEAQLESRPVQVSEEAKPENIVPPPVIEVRPEPKGVVQEITPPVTEPTPEVSQPSQPAAEQPVESRQPVVVPPVEAVVASSVAQATNGTTAISALPAPETGSTIQCSVDGGPWAECKSSDTLSLAEGTHSLSVRAIDAEGKVRTLAATFTWIVDTTPPETSLTSDVREATNKTSATFTFASPDATATFECSVDGGPYASCASPVTVNAVEGSHTHSARATDPAGNTGAPASVKWTVDMTPPTFDGLREATAVSSVRADLSWNPGPEADAVYHVCRSAVAGACASAFTSSYVTAPGESSYSITGLTPFATYFFLVRAEDPAGNVDSNEVEKSARTHLVPTLAYQVDGEAEFDGLGWDVSLMSDLYGDGIPEILAGAPGENSPIGVEYAGAVYVLSGADGSVLLTTCGTQVSGQLSYVFSPGDLNGDGLADYGASEWSGRAEKVTRMFSSRDGSVLAARKRDSWMPAQYDVAPLGDVDGDSKVDCAWGHTGFDETAGTYVGGVEVGPCLGGREADLYTLRSEQAGDLFGTVIASAGDVNGDGRPDLLVGAPYSDVEFVPGVGRVYLFSGADGSLVLKINGSQTIGKLGSAIASLGDVDSDGVPDFAAGIPGATVEGQRGVGRVCVYSGKNGRTKFCVDGEIASKRYGETLTAIGDLDGDGLRELAVTVLTTKADEKDRVDIRSGKDGRRLLTLNRPEVETSFGQAIASGDLNADGKPDLVIGAPNAKPNGLQGAGSVYVYIAQ
ncbi:MAG: FG-GAP repeat protein [Nitrospirae bacterium]|nr:FG-GAP repeat protein [Nitrospirota bacterium]